MVEILRILFIEGARPISTTWKHARSKKTADTHIPPSRVKTEKERYVNLPYEQSSPASILDNAAATRYRSPLLRFLPRPWLRRPMRQPSGSKQRYFLPKPRRLPWPHVDVWCKPTLHPVDFEPPLPLGQQYSFFTDAKSSFVSPRGKAGSKYSFRYFCLMYANFYLTAHLTTVCFAYPCLLCCMWRFSSVKW